MTFLQNFAIIIFAALFLAMVIYGVYTEIRGVKCPKCNKYRMDEIAPDLWKCPVCGRFTIL